MATSPTERFESKLHLSRHGFHRYHDKGRLAFQPIDRDPDSHSVSGFCWLQPSSSDAGLVNLFICRRLDCGPWAFGVDVWEFSAWIG